MFQTHVKVLDHVLDLVFHHDVRYFDGRIGNRFGNGSLTERRLIFLLSRFRQFCQRLGLHFFQRISIAGLFGEVVIKLRQFFALDVIDFGGEHGFFASQLRYKILLRECHFHFPLFTGFSAEQLIFESGNETAGTHFQRISFGLAAAERFAVHHAIKIDNREIAIGQFRIFHYDHFGVPLAQRLNLFVDFFRRHFGGRRFHAKTFVFTQHDFGTSHHTDREHARFACVQGYFGDFRPAYRLNILLFDRLAVCVGNDEIKRFGPHSIGTDPIFNHLARRFAFAETGDIDLLRQFLISPVKSLVDLFNRQFDHQFGNIVFFFFNCNFHLMSSFESCMNFSARSRKQPFALNFILTFLTIKNNRQRKSRQKSAGT